MTDRPVCEGTTKAGARCRSFAAGGRYCFPHDPANAERMRQARLRGASKGGRLKAIRGRRLKLDSATALLRFNAELAQDTLSGAVDPGVSRAVSYAIANQLRLLEVGEHERRLGEIERLLGEQRGGKRWA